MTPQVNVSVPRPVQAPPTIRMATSNLLHWVSSNGALPECADSAERSRTCLLRRECESKDGSDKERNLCAVHGTALPEVRSTS
jgi:hypothetical protein